MELLFITDVSQLAYLREHCPELLRSATPVVEDVVVAYELERMGVAFIEEWSLLTPAEIEDNSAVAHRLAANWWDESRASTDYRGIRLSDMVRQDLIYPLEACLNARTVYRKLFASVDITRISGFFLPPTGVVRTGPLPASRAVRSVAQAVLFYMAQQRAIPVQRRETGLPLSAGRVSYQSAALPQRAAAPLTSGNAQAGKLVLIYEDGMYPEELAALRHILADLPDTRVLTVSQRVLGLAPEVLPASAELSALLDRFWSQCEARTEGDAGEFPEIFGNRHLLFQFRSVCNEMRTAAILGDAFAGFLDALAPTIVVFGHEAFARERAMVGIARQRGIPSMALMHGIVRPRFTYQGIVGDADAVLVSNQADFDGLVAYGVDSGRIHQVGCVRFALQTPFSSAAADPRAARRAAKSRLGLVPSKPVVLWTTAAINASYASPVASPQAHRESIRQMAGLMARRPELQFVIKAHPSYDYYGIYRSLLDLGLPNLSFPEHVSLDDVIAASDACLLINYCTSAVIEAVLQRIPVIYLERAVYPLPSRRDNLALAGLQRVADVASLETGLNVALACGPGEQAALQRLEDALRSYLRMAPGGVRDALSAAIVQAMAQAQAVAPARCGGAEDDPRRAFVQAYLVGLGAADRGRASGKIRGASLRAYLLGWLGRGPQTTSRWDAVRLLAFLVLRPLECLAWPADFRTHVIRQLAKRALGEGGLSFAYYWLRVGRKASAKSPKAPKGP